MRDRFDRQLASLRQEVVSILKDVDIELHDAVDALVEGDRDKAKRTKKATKQIDLRCEELEDEVYRVLTLQQPVASDLRLIQFVVYADFNLQRMSNHARNIAKTAKRASKTEVPAQLLELLASEGHLVYRVLGTLAEAIVEGDIAKAASLTELDEPVDKIYHEFYRSFAQLKEGDDLEAATRVMMAARMLERISDNAVEMGERAVFLFTGKRVKLSELSEMDEDEVEHLYVAAGRGFTLGRDKDLELVNQIPEVSIDAEDEVAGANDFRQAAVRSLAELRESHERRHEAVQRKLLEAQRELVNGAAERRAGKDADAHRGDSAPADAKAAPTDEAADSKCAQATEGDQHEAGQADA